MSRMCEPAYKPTSTWQDRAGDQSVTVGTESQLPQGPCVIVGGSPVHWASGIRVGG